MTVGAVVVVTQSSTAEIRGTQQQAQPAACVAGAGQGAGGRTSDQVSGQATGQTAGRTAGRSTDLASRRAAREAARRQVALERRRVSAWWQARASDPDLVPPLEAPRARAARLRGTWTDRTGAHHHHGDGQAPAMAAPVPAPAAPAAGSGECTSPDGTPVVAQPGVGQSPQPAQPGAVESPQPAQPGAVESPQPAEPGAVESPQPAQPGVVESPQPGAVQPPPPPAAGGLEILGNNCAESRLEPHDGFQNGNRCVSTAFGEVGAAETNPSLLITESPEQVQVNQAFDIKVSTRNLVRDRFLAAGQGGYYLESSFLNAEGLVRGHFHTACRMLGNQGEAPDPAPVPAFFVATEDGQGSRDPDVVTVRIAGLPEAGTAQCASWAGDGSHRVPMMQRANQVPAFDVVRVEVTP